MFIIDEAETTTTTTKIMFHSFLVLFKKKHLNDDRGEINLFYEHCVFV
jgi:hypothetical protein